MSEGQDNEKTKEFSPEELEKFAKGLPPDTSEKPMEIEVEEVSLEDVLDSDKPILKDEPSPPKTYTFPPADPRSVKIDPKAEQRTVTFKKSEDTEKHTATRIGKEKSETSVWKLGDLRESKQKIFRGYEGLPWVIAELVRKTNQAIAKEELQGKYIKEGDIVQACIVKYYDGAVHIPRTTPDSPKYATLPYRIIETEEGYLSTEPAIPEAAKIDFNIAKTVGDLIPIDKTLKPDEIDTFKREVLVTLQLKEAAHKIEGTNLETIAQQPQPIYDSTTATKEAEEFFKFNEENKQQTPVNTSKGPDYQSTTKRLSERLLKTNNQFKFEP